MLRSLLILSFIYLLALPNHAQELITCDLDSAFVASGALVSPTPFVNDTLGEGINAEACINTPYDFQVSLHAPDSLIIAALGGLSVSIRSVTVTDVEGLPEGMGFECSFPDCDFPGDSVGCVRLTGTPTAANEVGDYELFIKLSLRTALLPVSVTFPDTSGTLGLPDGSYTITLNPEGSSNCEITSSADDISLLEQFSIWPNPVREQLSLEWNSTRRGDASVRLMSSDGVLIKVQDVSLNGQQKHNLDMNGLPPGIYFVGLQTELGQHWARVLKE